ncbi:hypothetical protein A9Q81_03920 [Gammaproteobacteria bacterium 42_54_T18]|nr:hypothetical protein A9Q81_03920 [Gammaproteobacteria bacterium 42_54_T18]
MNRGKGFNGLLLTASILVSILISLVSRSSFAVQWQFDKFSLDINNSLSLSSSWRVQERDENNISYGNTGNLIQIGDPISSLRFFPPVASENLGTNGLPGPGETLPGRYISADPSICEEAGISVSGASACWVPYFPDGGPGAYDENSDNGNLNFDKGLFSKQFRSFHEIKLQGESFGLTTRLLFFYDDYIENENLPHHELSDESKDLVGSDMRVLDLYGDLDVFLYDHPVSIRFGKQVISWGESGFISGMSAYQTPLDFNQLILSGFDLKQGSIPTQSLLVFFGMTENTSAEFYVKNEWKPNIFPPVGSYFSFTDIIGEGGDQICINGGMVPDSSESKICVARDEDRLARDQGQFGLKLSWLVPSLNYTEFSAYYMRYHDPNPVLGGREGIPDTTVPDVLQAKYFLQYIEDLELFGLSFNTVAPWGSSISGEVTYRKDVPLTIDISELLGAAVGNLLNLLFYDEAQGGDLARILASDNVNLPLIFSALQSEILPLIGTGEMADWLATQPTSDFRDDPNEGNNCQTDRPCFPAYQVDLLDPLSGDELDAYIKRDIVKANLLFAHTFPASWLKTDQLLAIAEVGATYVVDHPEYDELRLLTPGTEGRGAANALLPVRGLPCCDRDTWSDAFSWGYALRLQADYPGILGYFTLQPSITFKHDVSGIAPTNAMGFTEGNKIIRLGLSAEYQATTKLSIDYTGLSGNHKRNLLHDRDFVSLTLSHSF